MRGVPIYATLLALEVDGRLAVGVVSAPGLAASLVQLAGWRRLGRRPRCPAAGIGVGDAACRSRTWTGLDEASLVYSSLSQRRAVGFGARVRGLLSEVWRDRGLGDFYGYMLVAEGAAEVMIEAELKLWDLAGPRAVLEQAGARVTDLVGGPDMPAHGVLATNGRLHESSSTRWPGRRR